MTAAVSLFLFTVRQTIGQRRALVALLLLFSPAFIGLLMRTAGGDGHGPPLWEMHQGLMIFMLLSGALPITAMLYGPALIGAEAESGTLVYLFTRRLRRYQVLLVRFAAQALVLGAQGMAAVTAVHAVLVAGQPAHVLAEQWGGASPSAELYAYLSVVPPASVAFLAVFMAISAVMRKALVISGLYLVVVEIVIANLPAGVRVYSISHQVRRSLVGRIPRLRDVFNLDAEPALAMYPAGASGATALFVVLVALLIVAALAVSRRELSARPTTQE
jgi:hypothetical protein